MNIIKFSKLLSFVVVCSITLSACTFFETPQSSTDEQNFELDQKFISEVELVCLEIDEVAVQALRSNFSLNDPEFFQQTLSDAEEEFDKIIAGFTALDPQQEFSSEWQTYLDDFTAIRDSFPDLANVLNQLVGLEQTQALTLEPEIDEQNQVKIDDLENEYDMLNRGNSQRVEAIDETSEEFGINECKLN